ncbi:MAG: GNAT family N-acetyltransferase [Rhizobacter sp.]
MTIEIVQAPSGFNQWAELLALLHTAFAYQRERIDPPSSLYRLDAESLAHKAQEETLFLAVEAGDMVGCAFAKVKPDCVYVGKVAVQPGLQGQGIGRRLMQAVEHFARQTGKPVLELETRIELVENHQTFAAFGFVRTAEHAHAGYTRPTFVTMQKSLTSPAP